MEGVGSPPLRHTVQDAKTALQNPGAEAATKTVENAGRTARDLTTRKLAAAAPQRGNADREVPPPPGYGLGQHIDIKV